MSQYDALIRSAATRHGIPPGLLLGLVDHESDFNARAIRGEAHIGDASRGLTQLLLGTARALGYTGTAEGLFEPAVNVELGARLLAGNFAQLGRDWLRALSAYNGGNRPQLAFGTRATVAGRVCLAKDSQGKCVRWFSYQPGQFGNQPYVDAVVRAAAAYGWRPIPDFSDVQGGSSSTAVILPPKPTLPRFDLPTVAELAAEITGSAPLPAPRAPLSTVNKTLMVLLTVGGLLLLLRR